VLEGRRAGRISLHKTRTAPGMGFEFAIQEAVVQLHLLLHESHYRHCIFCCHLCFEILGDVTVVNSITGLCTTELYAIPAKK
jgi:hypothetical protein